MGKVYPWILKRNRERSTSPYYDIYNSARWRKAAKRYRNSVKLCEYMLVTYPKKALVPVDEKIIPIDTVDHIIPLHLGGSVWDQRNWQGLTRTANIWKGSKEQYTPMYYWTTNEQGEKIPKRDKDGKLMLNKRKKSNR